MRRTRFMSLFFAVLALAFFAVPAFRQAFEVPITAVLVSRGRFNHSIPEPELAQWAKDGEANRDARALAFVAMHAKDGAQAFRYADEATAIDPSLRWIYFSLAWVNRSGPEALKVAHNLQSLDPQNALGYLQEAEYLRESAKLKVNWLSLDERAAQTEWRAAMAKAFAAPHYDSYAPERFSLERSFLASRGALTPIRMLFSLVTYPIPNLLNIRQYADLLTRKIGGDADKAGKTKEAQAQYWVVAHFGERMQSGEVSFLEQLIGIAVQRAGYQALIPALQKDGQADAAATLASIMPEQEVRLAQLRGRDDIFSVSANYLWTAFLIYVLEGLVVVFAVLTLVSFAYVNAKRWVNPEFKGRLFVTITVAENYAPILLFIFSAGLYLTYYPYAVNFQHYMTATGSMRDFESFFRNTMPLPDAVVGQQLPFGNPLVPYVWFALLGVAIVVVPVWLLRMRSKQEAPKAIGAAAGR